jgi:hypothetical protein
MLTKQYIRKWPAFSLLFCCTAYASAQSTSTQQPTQDTDRARSTSDRDIDHQELRSFNRFLDDHREIGEQLRKDPSLVDNRQFLKDHPVLESYLKDHPAVRQQLQQDPNAFMRNEDHYAETRDRNTERRDLANFDRFLDGHPQIGEQLQKDPSLVDNSQYLKDHPQLQSYLQDHPAVRQQIKDNPDAFMRAEGRFQDSRELRELASFNQFLDNHREIGEQLRKDPSLADNRQFLKDHPVLESYLKDHPAVRQQLQQDPNAFMQEEARFERHDEDMNRGGSYDRDRGNGFDRDRGNGFDRDRDAQRHFGEFLSTHPDVAQQLSKAPSLAQKQDYLQDHPELQDYLSQHPEAKPPLMSDPQSFVNKSTEQWNNGQPMKAAPPQPAPAGSPKPDKQ